MRVRISVALAALLSVVGLGAPAAAVDPAPIGGPELASSGLVVHPGPTTPELPASVLAPAWIVADLDSGDVLAAKDPHGRYRPASTLKMLTALALLPSEGPSTTYVPTEDMAKIDGSRVGVEAGKSYTQAQILQAMMLASGNDATEAFAAAYPGGRGEAMKRLNEVAKSLQANDTVAVNPTGLDATGQFSSPYDLALIARALLRDPVLAAVVKLPRSTFPCSHGPSCKNGTFDIQNHNNVVTSIEGALGVKSGGTSLARLVVVGAVGQNGHRIVAVTMRTESVPFTQNIALLNWGLKAVGTVTPVGALVGPAQTSAAAPAEQVKTKKTVAVAEKKSSSHWRRNVLLLSVVIAAATVWVRRRRPAPKRRAVTNRDYTDSWARITAVVTPHAPPAASEPFDQDVP